MIQIFELKITRTLVMTMPTPWIVAVEQMVSDFFSHFHDDQVRQGIYEIVLTFLGNESSEVETDDSELDKLDELRNLNPPNTNGFSTVSNVIQQASLQSKIGVSIISIN